MCWCWSDRGSQIQHLSFSHPCRANPRRGMMGMMKHRLIQAIAALIVLATPLLAWAAENDEVKYDAKAVGFKRGEGQTVIAGDASTALTWMLFIFLAMVCLSVMFKNAKRTHLD